MNHSAQQDNSGQPSQDNAAVIEQLAQAAFAQLQQRTVAAAPAAASTTAGAQAEATGSTLPDLSAEPALNVGHPAAGHAAPAPTAAEQVGQEMAQPAAGEVLAGEMGSPTGDARNAKPDYAAMSDDELIQIISDVLDKISAG
jgi:hypothetical protein